MKATELLKAQHKEVKELFTRIQRSKGNDEKSEIFEKLAHALVAHDAIERQIFYPACQKEMGTTDLLGESMVEHGVIEFSLYLADQAQGDDDFDYKLTVLSEMVEHHVHEEEGELFPKVVKALGAERLDALGAEMEMRYQKLVAEDFHGPLRGNLRRVLDGATEIPADGASKTATKNKKPPRATAGGRAS